MIERFDQHKTPRPVPVGNQENDRKLEATEPEKILPPSVKDQHGGIPTIGQNHFADPGALVATILDYRERGLDRIIDLRVIFGFNTVFIPVLRGQKVPKSRNWPDFTLEKMDDKTYLSDLESGNIAILTGANSGNLISIDLDTDEAAEEFLKSNPTLCKQTVRTRGARGCNYWFRIKGDFPPGVKKLLGAGGEPIGELRAGRCITVVAGEHPDGMNYSSEGRCVISCPFEEIVWPDGWELPWVKDPLEELVEKEGAPVSVSQRGAIFINEPFFVAKFAMEHLVFHVPSLGFFEYEGTTGIWKPKTDVAINDQFSRDLKSFVNQTGQDQILLKRNAARLNSLTNQLKGRVELTDAFCGQPKGIVHAKNGMLSITAENVEVNDFSPNYYSLGQIPFDYNPDAKCPRFLSELLGHALSENDILLFQKYAGQVLLGKNISQTFLILEGEGGTGKGQIGAVIDAIVGDSNVAELRTEHLSGRFEMRSYLGKKLLAGRDVAGDFLNQKGAGAIKRLTGGDRMSVESKGRDERSMLIGEFNIIVTTNNRLVLGIEGDKSAWARRLLIIPFEHKPVDKPIPDFGKMLVREEGDGIFAWMVRGAQLLQNDLNVHGRIRLDTEQRKRIVDLLAESDSVTAFVACRLVRAEGKKVFTHEMFERYKDFCLNTDMQPVNKQAFERRVKTEIFQAKKGHPSENISRNGKRGRGYTGVRVLREEETDGANGMMA